MNVAKALQLFVQAQNTQRWRDQTRLNGVVRIAPLNREEIAEAEYMLREMLNEPLAEIPK